MNIDLDFHSGRSDHRLIGEVEDTVYRFVQEAVNNAVQHADAEHVRVEVSEDGELLRARIADRGCGFDPEAPSEGFGLIGMRERIELAGGALEIESAAGKGRRSPRPSPPPTATRSTRTPAASSLPPPRPEALRPRASPGRRSSRGGRDAGWRQARGDGAPARSPRSWPAPGRGRSERSR